jgi:tetratricopeptide (TPR) repeat protein
MLAVGIAERIAAEGRAAGALPWFEKALERPALRGLRSVAAVRLAAGLAAVAAGDEGRATGFLLGAMAEDAAVTVAARRALADLRIAQGDAARATMELSKLADAQQGADRGRTLRELGQTLALALGDLAGAVAALEEAARILPPGTDDARGAAEDLLDLYSNVENWPAAVQLAQSLARTGEGPGRSRFHLAAAEALSALGQEDAAFEELRLAREVDPANPRVAAQIEKALEGRGEVRQLLKDLAARLAGELPKDERARILTRIGDLRAERNADPVGASGAYEEALRLGNLDAGERLAALLEAHPDRVFDALAVHRKVLAADPARVGSLRALHRVYVGLGAGPEAAAVASILRLFDRTVPDPGEPPRLEDLRAPPEGALEALRPAGLSVWLERFALVWEGGFPLFRRDLPAFGVSGADRVSPLAETPLAKVYAGAIRVLGLAKTPVFVRLSGTGTIEVAATYPPSVIVGPELRPDSAEGRFLVGRAVEATRPALVLATVLDRARATTLFEATLGAFGPAPKADAPPIAKESADLAAALWKTLPPRAQRRLQEICATAAKDGDAQAWLDAVRRSTNRAGLLVSGEAAASLRVVARETPALAGVDVGTEHGFREAVRRSPEIADLAAFAVSDEYLSLRWRADVGRPR